MNHIHEIGTLSIAIKETKNNRMYERYQAFFSDNNKRNTIIFYKFQVLFGNNLLDNFVLQFFYNIRIY